MASGGENMIVDLSDNDDDDDDCVLESVTYKVKKKQNNNYDNIFKENPLLAEVIEKCLNLETSEGMSRIINRTLLGIYKEADPKFKSSSDFETVLKRTLISLDKDPYHKFSHIKGLCETLRSSKFKKRVSFVTLEKKKRKKSLQKLKRKSDLERSNKKQKTDVIDLDKYEDVSIINLDQNDTIDDGPIVIDDEKEKDIWVELNSDNSTEHVNGTMQNYCDIKKTSKKLNDQIENEGTILNIDEEKENQSSVENDCCIEINDDKLRIHNNRQSGNNISITTLETVNNHKEHEENDLTVHDNGKKENNRVSVHIDHVKQSCTARENVNRSSSSNVYNFCKGQILNSSPEKLLVPQKEFDLAIEDNSPKNTDLQKIKQIEDEIAKCKRWIAKLDEQEVTDDNSLSPYLRSEKYKQKIVKLYKELCALTGSEVTKRREVRLTVIEGHPPGPVKRLEMFLNKNIGEDGNPPFPDFDDVVKCVETANVNDNLYWTRNRVLREAGALFIHCGRALQKRRQKREWSDLLSRVKAEECDSDPADNDPELLARLEANRRVAVKKEADLLERYSMMQNLPPERNTAFNAVSRSEADEDVVMRSVSNDSSVDSPQVPSNINNVIAPTMDSHTNQFDSNKLVNVDTNPKEYHSVIGTNTFIHSVENADSLMPQIIAESITNKSYVDEFGLKINDSKDISNVKYNSVSAVSLKSEPNVEDVNYECNAAVTNKIHVARLDFESNVEKNFQSNVKSNAREINFESYDSSSKNKSNIKSNVRGDNFESNIATIGIHGQRLKFESNFDDSNLEENNLEIKVESNIERVNTESNVQVNFESNPEEVNSTEANIKIEPTENVAKILNDFGNNYTVSVFDIEDPFLIVEISDSSDEED